ncbi:MAG: hypothetical protein IKE18_06625, partial [Oscillospiraceae bacterium]|nr:hypothetical protein [Oscillospiraceae bacterium]
MSSGFTRKKSTTKSAHGRLSKLISILMVFCMALTLVPYQALPVFAAAGDIPENSKERSDNGDGTYKLELSVTGDADNKVESASNVNV